MFDATYPIETYCSLIPVIAGVGLATYGDYYATVTGFFVTLLGAALAAVKTVVTNRLQTAGLHLNAIELLHRMAPLAMLQTFVAAWVHGEVAACRRNVLLKGNIDGTLCTMLVANGAIAFGLNLISFSANKKVGALTMTVAANVKQILTTVLSFMVWKMEIGWLNVVGMLRLTFFFERLELTLRAV